MTRRSVVAGLLVWVAVVVVAATATWAVIDSAGERVMSGEQGRTALPGSAYGTVGLPNGAPATGSGSAGPSPRASQSAAAPAPRSRSASPTTPGRTPEGGGTAATPGTDDRATPSRQRTWEGVPGTVVAACTGSTVQLRSATPNDGYRAEIEADEPGEAEVKFEPSTGAETKVRVVCTGGAPRFSVEQDSADD